MRESNSQLAVLTQKVLQKMNSVFRFCSYELSKRQLNKYSKACPLCEISKLYPDPNEQWRYFHNFFWNLAPKWLREHRAFFRVDNRGFGEDAFHAMWYILLSEVKPKTFLEIGVYRGQVLSLVKLISNKMNFPCRVLGVSPFNNATDSVSVYHNFDYEKDVREFCRHFETPLAENELCRALSTEKAASAAISSAQWYVAYIDGNHDYDVAKSDFKLVSSNLHPEGFIVLDDAGLSTNYRPNSFSFAGHPGPSKVLQEAILEGWKCVAQAGHNIILKRTSNDVLSS